MDNLLFKTGNSGQVNVDQLQGIVECFVAGIGNKDSVGDVVVTGAFAKSLLRRKPRVVWGHSWNDPIGKVLEMYEVPVGDSRLPAKMRNAGIGGLYAKVQFNLQSEKGKEAFATVAFFGEDQEWSIGYKTIDSVFDQSLQANILKELELYEVSPVLHGANQLTGTISIKTDEKAHMPIIPMQVDGMPIMPTMNQAPRIVVVAAPTDQQDESSTDNPFAEGMSRELGQPEKVALQAELTDRTGSQIEVMNATENIVVFRRTTSDGKASMYRLPYHKEGSAYMFGKPEPYQAEAPQPQPMQNIQQKPGAPVVVPNGGIAYRNDDQQEMMNLFGGNVAMPFEKSDVSHLIELPEVYMAAAKDYLNPVLRHHKLAGRPSSKGIIIDGLLTANALDALQNAVKALGATIGQASGNIGQAIGKIRDLAQSFNPYALDGDGDGFVQDGSAFQRPYIPIKKPGFDLPDVRGRKRSGDSLLDKPKTAPKLPKDKNTWTRAQRNDALVSGLIEPETREDIAFLSNRRPDNEGIAKYWDMSEADLTKEGNRLVNARRQATGAEKEKIDEELLKVSHDFQRRASYAETFGQDFVPPAKREMPNLDLVPVDITENESIARMLGAPKSKKPRTDDGFASAGKVFDKLNSGDQDEFREWDDLSDDEKLDMFQEVQEDYMYDNYMQLGDDGLVEAMESSDYDDEILEHAEEVYNKIRAARIKKREDDEAKAEREEDERFAQTEAGRAFEAEDERRAREDAADYAREQAEEAEIAERRRERDLDRQADAAIDYALEQAIEKYGEDGLASRGRDLDWEETKPGSGVWNAVGNNPRSSRGDSIYTITEDEDGVFGVDAVHGYSYQRDGGTDYDEEYFDNIFETLEEAKEFVSRTDDLREDEGEDEDDFQPSDSDIFAEQEMMDDFRDQGDGFASRGDGEFGSNPKDSKAAKAFDALLDKYWKMWGFDVPDEDEEGQDEPFGFASRGNDEEVKQEKLDELVEGVRVRLLAELETADPATWKPSWRNDSLPINVTTGKPYRGFNAFWLMLRASGENYKTGRYAGFNQLKARGAQVRKGEKGVPILRPQLVKKTDEDGNVKEFVRFRGTTVFNIDQADGGDEALRAVAADLPEEQRIAILDTTIAELGVDVRTENTTPHYSPTEDYVSMPDFAKGTSPLEWNSTLAHETIHWTGGASRLNRPSVANYSDDKKVRAYEELVAEIGSAMFLAAHGIEAPFRQDHAPYIKGWLQLLKDDPDALGRAFKDAQAAINHLLEKSPNLRKLFGGLDNGKKSSDIDAPDKAEALVGASDGFASLHRVRTPRSEALTGILYDDNSGDLMVGFQKGKPWDKLSQNERENWIGRAEKDLRDRGGLPLTDNIDAVAKDMYDDSRDTGWYVYSEVSMEEVQELAAARSKGKHINALKKLKTARKATDEDNFNFFGRDERVQDVGRSMSPDGFASRGATEPNEGLRRHKLMPAEVRAGMPDLYSTEDVPLEEKVLAAKFFSPYSNWTWYAVEFDGDDTFFGYVEGFENEWGNFSLSELAETTIGGSLPAVERDRGFRPTKFGDLNKSDGLASRGGNENISIEKDRRGQWVMSAMVNGNRGASEENRGTRRMQYTVVGGSRRDALKAFRDYMSENNVSFSGEDGFASSGSKKLGIEPRFTDSDWVDKTQQRILRSGLDFQSLSENDKIDWANSFLDEWLRENDMGYGLSDVANGRRINRRPDIELLNYAENAFARMSDAHAARRSGFGEETQGLASVGSRTRRLGIQPSEAVDYVSYDPDSESLFVAYKREDGRGDMYVYEGVDMDDAIGIENASSVGRAINDIKRRKNVRKATPEEVIGLAESESKEGKALKRRKALSTIDAVYSDSRHGNKNRDVQLEINADRIDVDGGTVTWTSNDDTAKYSISMDDDGGYTVTAEKLVRGDRETPDDWEELSSVKTDTREDAITALFEAANAKISGDIEESRLDRELAEAKRELDKSGDAPGVISLDVTYSSALDAVDYNPSTQEMRVSFKDGGTYIYEGVDRETFDGFSAAPSKGRAMNDIKRAYPYRKDSEWASGGDDEGGMEEFDVRGSEAVEKVTYDPETEDMLVVYAGGKGYVYTGVTRAEADAVRSAPSKGRAINDVKRTHEVRLLTGEDIRLFTNKRFGGKKDSEREDGVATSELSPIQADQYKRVARSVADQIINAEDEIVEDPAFDRRLRGPYYPEWDVVPDWLKKSHIKWMNENNPKSSGSWTEDEVGEMFNAAREILMNTGVKGKERKVTTGRRIPKSDLDRFEKESRDGLFDMMRRTYDSLLMSNDYDKEKARAKFREMFDGNTIEFASDSAVLSGDVPIIDADGDRIDPQGYKIRPTKGFDLYERVIPAGADVGTGSIDPAPVAKPKIPTSKPPRGGKRVRNRNVTITMEQGDLDEIIAAESGKTTVDALRAAKGVGKYTKGPRKGKRRGPDTIAVRDAETGELLHFNEIELTSSSADYYVGRKQGQSPTGKKRGFIRARSYAGRQNHKIVGDEGPSLRGEGKGMTEYDKRVYGLGSDEKNREFGLASRGRLLDSTPQEEKESFENYLDSEYGADFLDYTQMSDEEVKNSVMRGYRYSRSEANAFVKKLRKDQDRYDELSMAADNALDDEDGFASRNISRLQFMELDKTEDWSDLGEAEQQEWISELELEGAFDPDLTADEKVDIAKDEWDERAAKQKDFVTDVILKNLDTIRRVLADEPDGELGGYGLDGIAILSIEEMIDNPLEADSSDYREALKRLESMKDRLDAYLAVRRRSNDDDEDGFASRSGVIQPNEKPERPLIVQEEWLDFDELDAETQDRIIQSSNEDRFGAIEQWNDDARAARAEAAESLLKEIYDLWDQDADADNPFQRNGNLAYSEELIKNTSYVGDLELAEARNIVDEVRERFERRNRDSIDDDSDYDDEDGFASRFAEDVYKSGYGASGFDELTSIDPAGSFAENFRPRDQNEGDYLNLPKDVRGMLWDMTTDKRNNIGSWEDYYRESISLGASYRVPNVENQPNALNAWQLLAPSEGQRGRSGAYKQWNVQIVNNPRGGYDIVKSYGKLEDVDAISTRSNRGSLKEQKIGTTSNYRQALKMARQAVSQKINEGKGYRITRTNDRGARSERDIGPGLTQNEKDIAQRVRKARKDIMEAVGASGLSSRGGDEDGFASRGGQGRLDFVMADIERSATMPNNMDILLDDRDYSDLTKEERVGVVEKLAELFPQITETRDWERYGSGNTSFARNFYQRRLDFARAGEEISSEYDWDVEKLDDGSIRWTTGDPEGGDLENNGDVGLVGTITKRPDGKYESSWYTQGLSNMSPPRGARGLPENYDPGDSGDIEEINSGGGVFDTLEEAADDAYDDGVGSYQPSDYYDPYDYNDRSDGFASRGADGGDEIDYDADVIPRSYDQDYGIRHSAADLNDELLERGVDPDEVDRIVANWVGSDARWEEYLGDTADGEPFSIKHTADAAISLYEDYLNQLNDSMEGERDGFASRPTREGDPIEYFKYLVDSGAFDPDSDDAMEYIRDEGLPKYLLSYGEGRGGSGRRRYPESTARYGGSGLSNEQKKEIIDTLDGSSDEFIQKLLSDFRKRGVLSDKQWGVLKGRADREKKKTAPKKPSGFVSDVRNGGTIAPGARPVVSAGKNPIVSPTREQIADIAGLEKIISEAKYNGQALRFNYNGKEREVFPVSTYTNPKTGKVNMVAQDAEGVQKTFTIDKMSPSEMASSTNDGFASRGDAPTKTSLRRAATEKRAEIRSMIEDQGLFDPREPSERPAYNAMEKRIDDAQAELRDIERQIRNMPSREATNDPRQAANDIIRGNGFASRGSAETKQNLRDFVTGVFGDDPDFALGDDDNKNDEAIDLFLENYGIYGINEDIYEAGEELLEPESGLTDRQKEFVERIRSTIENRWESAYIRSYEDLPDRPSRRDRAADIQKYGFASRMTEADRNDLRADTANYPDDYEADMANMASQDMANNFARLSKDDQNMYFQRALANNADSGMTTEQILDEARKLAMDDRQMAMLERQAIGMGGSSKPRKIDVSSSSALNSVSYDEMNESLQVEYRGRDGKGTGTLYTYEGVTPDVVDRIEAADSRGATMREIRDNFEFTTSRKLPDSAYEGLASRSEGNQDADFSKASPRLREKANRVMELRDRIIRDASRYRDDDYVGQDVVDALSGGYVERDGTLYFPSKEYEGNFISLRYNPDTDQYVIERVRTTRGFNRDEPDDATVVQLEIEKSSFNAGSRVFDFAREQVKQDRANADYSEDDGFASRGSINESSTGQRIVPSKMHSDDREALAEVSDPEERKKYIDRLIDFYGPRIFAKPSSPRRKRIVQTQDENGFWVNPDGTPVDYNEGFASRSTEEAQQNGLKPAREYQSMVYDLPEVDNRGRGGRHSTLNPDGAYNLTRDRYKLIHARREIAREMAEAFDVPFNKDTEYYDITEDQEYLDILEQLNDRIEAFNNAQTEFDREFIETHQGEQIALSRQREAQELGEQAKSLYDDLDDDMEYVDEIRKSAELLLREFKREFGREGFDKGRERSDGGGGYHEDSDVADARLAQAESLLESGNPEDVTKALEEMEAASKIYADKFNADYFIAEASGDELTDRGYRFVPGGDDIDYNPRDWEYYQGDFDEDDGSELNFIEDSLFGPSLEEVTSGISARRQGVRRSSPDEGFSSRGNRRRPGRRNQGRRNQPMAPKTRYSDEDRQALADRNILRSRARPGKRRPGPSADEFDGFASRSNPDDVADMPTDERVIFEGGEHGPGKEISLNEMWRKYMRGVPSLTAGGRQKPDKWGSTEPLYDQETVFDMETGKYKKQRRLLQSPATIDEFMERFGPDSSVGLDRASVMRLMDARKPKSPEVFIDDPALAGRLATALGRDRTRLFGFDPDGYYDDDGNPIDFVSMMDFDDDGNLMSVSDEQLEAIAEQERARRVARMAARASRVGKRDIIQRRPDPSSQASPAPVGEMTLKEFEAKLQKTFGQSVRLTDNEGNALPAERMKANIEKSGIPFPFTSIEPFRQMQKRQILPYEYAKELVKMGVLKPSDLPSRASSALGEFSQWPGFVKANVRMPDVVRALADVGIDIGEKNRRSIQQGLNDAKKGALRKINTGKLRGDSVLIPVAKLREMVERLGLDADEFVKWFGSTFTPSADKN